MWVSAMKRFIAAGAFDHFTLVPAIPIGRRAPKNSASAPRTPSRAREIRGDAVGHAGARGDRRDADLARVAARPRVGGVHRGLLVAHVDDADPLLVAARVERHDVAAAQGEDALDAGRFERATRENAAVDV